MKGTTVALETRIRVFVRGELVDEVTALMSAEVDVFAEFGERHGDLCAAAAERGWPWLVEIRFPDGEHVRWGTDPAGMVLPIETTIGRLEELLTKYGGQL